MKVAELVAAFQRFAAPQNTAGETSPKDNRAQAPVPASVVPEPEPLPTATDDRVSVSPEAIFTFAASLYDPQRITRPDVEALADILYDGGAISERDRAILASAPDRQSQSVYFESDPNSSTNLVTEFQGRLSVDLANSNIAAVEEDTRALSILGRLVSIREELA